MAILVTGNSWSDGDQVTAALLNSAINSATFASGAVDDSTTELNGSNQLIVKDGGITPAKLSTGGPSWTSAGVMSATALTRNDNTDGLSLIGGEASDGLSATIRLYGASHSSKAKDFEFASAGANELHYDDSASLWDFQDNSITTTGTLTAGIETGMVGAGNSLTHQASGTAITKQTSIFTTSTATNYAARLPIASSVALGTTLTVMMTGDLGFPIVVYPDDADTIDSDSVALGGNINVGSDQLAIFIKTAETVWTARSVNEGSIYAYGRSVWEANHGHTVGDILVKEVGGSSFVKANANNIDTCRQPQVVIEVPDSGVFKVGQIGWAFNSGDEGTLTGLSTNTVYYLSDSTAGTFTTVKPTAPGSYVVPVFVSYTSNSLIILAAGAEPTPVSLNTATLTPATASDTGTTGDIAWDSDYIYICTATDTWKRVAIATW